MFADFFDFTDFSDRIKLFFSVGMIQRGPGGEKKSVNIFDHPRSFYFDFARVPQAKSIDLKKLGICPILFRRIG